MAGGTQRRDDIHLFGVWRQLPDDAPGVMVAVGGFGRGFDSRRLHLRFKPKMDRDNRYIPR